jgi:hypothetical protein
VVNAPFIVCYLPFPVERHYTTTGGYSPNLRQGASDTGDTILPGDSGQFGD